MAGSSLQVVLVLCLLALSSSSCLASRLSQGGQQQQGQFGISQGECNLQNLSPQEPIHTLKHEAGFTEIWDQNNEQLRCAGVSALRHVIQPQGLLLPSFNNAPVIVFVIQGNGVLGTMFPGCPETFQSFQQSEQGGKGKGGQGQGGQSQKFGDQHQKIHQFYRGDVIALPVGVAHWAYNEGNEDVVLVVIHDISNFENQLDPNLRRFFLAGNPQQQQQQEGSWQAGQQQQQQQHQLHQGYNIFRAFDVQILSWAFGINQETAKKLQNENDWRGNIVRVKNKLRLLRPSGQEEQEQTGWSSNGFEETICTMRIKENLANPERADIYTARGGTISTLNSLNLPILKYLQLSAGRGNLRPKAMVAPHWGLNSHSISYIASGNGRVQIVGTSQKAVYDGEVRKGQLLIIPQNFAHVKIAGNEGLEWFTVKTNDRAKTSALVGKTSVLRALPEDVLINAYLLSREEARSVKYNREEVTILSPQFESQSESQQGKTPWSVV
ncbi:hypothetical protein ACH5RR_019130 [Cinchona calisaya]|uniref:Cupin type-1 domain-containing protein n=1 Tax=Cinchona calisaya TaxID=153742 RepID=A0ABD2ZNJ1_9GENT